MNEAYSRVIIDKKIRKFSDQYHALRVIFTDPAELSQEWFFSDIAVLIDPNKPGADKTYYNAVYQINLKFQAQNLKKLFITTKHSAKIDSSYLS